MIAFRVDDMSCSHCVATITRALKAADPAAQIEIDLVRRLVRVEPDACDAPTIAAAISEAGYTPQPVTAQP